MRPIAAPVSERRGAREAAKRMDRGGVIINLISTTGFRAATGISAYVASKHALVVLFLASDLAAWITGEIIVADAGSLAG